MYILYQIIFNFHFFNLNFFYFPTSSCPFVCTTSSHDLKFPMRWNLESSAWDPESTSWNPESNEVESWIQCMGSGVYIMESGIHCGGILNPVHGIRSLHHGIRNPMKWNLESSAWDPESTSWKPESKAVADYLRWGEFYMLSKLVTNTNRMIILTLQVLWHW